MTFKVGDKVKVINGRYGSQKNIGKTFVIEKVDTNWPCPYELEGEHSYRYFESELELIAEPKQFTKDDIRVGDKVKHLFGLYPKCEMKILGTEQLDTSFCVYVDIKHEDGLVETGFFDKRDLIRVDANPKDYLRDGFICVLRNDDKFIVYEESLLSTTINYELEDYDNELRNVYHDLDIMQIKTLGDQLIWEREEPKHSLIVMHKERDGLGGTYSDKETLIEEVEKLIKDKNTMQLIINLEVIDEEKRVKD